MSDEFNAELNAAMDAGVEKTEDEPQSIPEPTPAPAADEDVSSEERQGAKAEEDKAEQEASPAEAPVSVDVALKSESAPAPEPPKPEPEMFEMRFDDVEIATRIFKAIGQICEEPQFDVYRDKLVLRMMDASHICLIDVELKENSFEMWRVELPESKTKTSFVIRAEDILKLLPRVKKGKVEIFSGDDNMLGVSLLPDKRASIKRYEIHLIETTPSETPVPKITFNSAFKITGEAMKEVLKDNGVISDHITLVANPQANSITFSGKSEVGKFSLTMDRETPDILEIQNRSEDGQESTYAQSYVSEFVNTTNPDTMEVSFSTKMPVRLNWKPYEDDKDSFVNFWLAPRVDS
jgi:proliferating cell nuclear antigen